MSKSEKLEFQAETRQLLELMIHSLYKHKDIFLRELISNASDALNKLRIEALTHPEVYGDDERLRIRLEADADDHMLVISDNGIGMSRQEVIDNIGTIARSGTREFLEKVGEAKSKGAELSPELIGQFGVGFYSCFMVADRVVLDTRRAGDEQGVRWKSKGDGTYTVETIEKPDRGTTITLHLKKKPAGEDDFQDFTSEWTLRSTVKKYSDFVAYPIEMEVEREEADPDDAGKDDAKKKTRKVKRVEVLNSMKPIWTRSPSDVKPEEYADFYKAITHDLEPPLETIHFKAEGALEYRALLFIPREKPFAWFQPDHHQRSHLSLYVRRVFIMDDCEELLPPWLRFVRGLVDSDDLPLNVSRETLQHARQMKPIQRRLVGKVIETLKKMAKDQREPFEKFWREFGAVVKEGIYYDDESRGEVAAIALFQSTRAGGDPPALTTLGEYVERMPEGQKEIYYLTGTDRAQLEASPHLEALKKRGFEVLLMLDPVDDFAMQRLREFDGKPLKSLERGDFQLDETEDAAAKQAREDQQKALAPLLEAAKKALEKHVADVRFSNRLTDSPAVMVTSEHGLTPQMERLLKESRQAVPDSRRVLELNPQHPLIAKLDALRGDAEAFQDYCELVLGQALIAEGSPPPDAARFNRTLARILAGS